MKYLAALLIVAALTGCKSTSPSEELRASIPDANIKRRFETSIAQTILTEVRGSLPNLSGPARAAFLRQKNHQFSSSVNTSLISPTLMLESQLLAFLAEYADPNNRDSSHTNNSYTNNVNALTSLNWSLDTYEQKSRRELNRIDQTIAVLASDRNPARFDITSHLSQIRQSTGYPEDSDSGRQQYLDQLSEEMLTAQINWHSLLDRYEPSQLGITGVLQGPYAFHYEEEALIVNLAVTRDLPLFELKPISAFYGYPGLQSLTGKHPDSLRQFLDLPGYNLGWAGYIVDVIGTRDTTSSLDYLYFARLLTGLALADIRIHRDGWSLSRAVEDLYLKTPYSRRRIELMLNEVAAKPGYYLAGLAGKLALTDLHSTCLQERNNCEQKFNQLIVDIGPVPFTLLAERIRQL